MSFPIPFSPGASTDISVTGSSGSTSIGGSGSVLLITNLGSVTARISITEGAGATVASTNTLPIAAGVVQAFSCGTTPYVNAITASSTTTLNVTRGEGQ